MPSLCQILNQTPDAAATKADATITELRNEIAELKKGFGEIAQERTKAKTDSTTEAVTKFAQGEGVEAVSPAAEDVHHVPGNPAAHLPGEVLGRDAEAGLRAPGVLPPGPGR